MKRYRIAQGIGLFTLTLVPFPVVLAGGFPFNATDANAPMLVMRSSGNACGQGDPVTCTGDPTAITTNKYHLYFIEVPPGTGELTIELFDADVGLTDTGVGLDTATGRYDYELRNPANAIVPARFDRGVDTLTGIQSGAASVTCQPVGGPATAHNNWCRLINVSNPAAGHWAVRMTPNGASGQISSVGIRALDLVTNRDLNVYARSFIHWGNQSVAGRRLYTVADAAPAVAGNAFYPYVTAGCGLRTYDYDADIGAEVTIRHTSPVRSVVSTLTGTPPLSGGTAWASNVIALPSANSTQADEYGLWTAEFRVVGGANHVTTWASPSYINTSPPTTQPEPGSFRYYFGNNNGQKPLKPTVRQGLIGVVSGPNTPAVGVDTVYRIGIDINNPTPYPITFDASNLVTATIPADVGGAVDYGFVNPSFTASCGAVVAQPANDGTGTLTWNPGVIAAGQSCSAFFDLRVQPVAAGTMVLTTQAGVATGTTAQMLDETGTAFTFGPLCAPAITTGTNYNSVPVTLSYVSTTRVGELLQVEFETVSEAGSLAFELVDAITQRSLGLRIPARAAGEHEPTSYAAVVDLPSGSTFNIRQHEVGGKVEEFGPFTLGREHGERLQRVAIDWDTVAREQAEFRAREASGRSATGVAVARVTATGLYRIDHATLVNAGLDLSGVPADEIALIVDGQGFPREVSTAIFDAGSHIQFFARVEKQPYYGAALNVFVLRDASRAISWRKSTLRPRDAGVDRQWHTITVDANREYHSASPLSDPWYLRRLQRNNSNSVSVTETVSLPAAPAAGETANLQVKVWGGLDYPETGIDHAYSVSVNGTPVGSSQFDGINADIGSFELPAGLLLAGNNTVTLTTMATVHSTDRINVESIAVRYLGAAQADGASWRMTLDADEGQAVVVSDRVFDDGFAVAEQAACETCEPLRVAGLGSAARVFRLSGHEIVEEVLGSRTEGSNRVIAVPGPGDYVALEPQVLVDVASAPAPVSPPLDADLLVVTHPSFVDDLTPLVNARSAQGLVVAVVTTEQIMTHLRASRMTASALHQFIRSAASGQRLAYVLLVGGDSYDYDNILQLGSRSFVPTFYRPTHPLIRHSPTDVPYADIDDDGLADLAVGRFPVRTSAELQALVAKTLQWGTGGPTWNGALAVSDRVTGGYDFASQSVIMANGVAFGLPHSFLDLDDFADDANGNNAARTAMVQSVNAGLNWVNFYGHASPYLWTFSSFLSSSQVRNNLFANPNRPFIATQFGCWASYFVLPQYDSLVHALLNGSSGAVAMLGTTSLGESGSSTTLAAYMLPELGQEARLGDVWREGMRSNVTRNPDMMDVNTATILLGDPSLPIR